MRDAEAFIRGEQCSNIVGSAKCSEAVADVISQRLPTFYKTAYRLLGNAADAEDAVQDALLSAYKKLHQFRGEAQMSTWLTVIVGNCARMQLRRRRHIHLSLDEPIGQGQDSPLSERLPDHRPSPEDEYQETEKRAQLRKLTARLSPALSRTFHLSHVEGLSIQETATVLCIPVGT
jgi:RNA polymerase sigma-70 factor (ECF subfamily)